jgi:hypothetical protein
MSRIVLCDDAKRPRTCVLVIGVGAYPHLKGGSGPRAARTYNLGQLSSPAVSAARFTDWLQDGFSNPRAPVGTIDVLISPLDPAAAPAQTPATSGEVQDAFKAWLTECNTHPDNIAWFYFCGHGVRKGDDLALLLSDFGRGANSWSGALDFNETWARMRSAPGARTQLFFIDACQDTPAELANEGTPEMLVPVGAPLAARGRNAVALYAVEPGQQAGGARAEVSHFTQVVLEALGGKGAEVLRDSWVVQAHTIGNAIFNLAARARGYDGTRAPYLMFERQHKDVVIQEYREEPPFEPLDDGRIPPGPESPSWTRPAAVATAAVAGPRPIYCYACPPDRAVLGTILDGLRLLVRERARVFTEDDILPGSMEEKEKEKALAQAEVGLIILSAAIQAPKYQPERDRLLRAHRERGLALLWVQATACFPAAMGFTMKPAYPTVLGRLSEGERYDAYHDIALAVQRAAFGEADPRD